MLRNGTESVGECSSSTSASSQQDIEDDRMIAVLLTEEYANLDNAVGRRLTNLAPIPVRPFSILVISTMFQKYGIVNHNNLRAETLSGHYILLLLFFKWFLTLIMYICFFCYYIWINRYCINLVGNSVCINMRKCIYVNIWRRGGGIKKTVEPLLLNIGEPFY